MTALLGEDTCEGEPEALVADRYRVESLLGTGGMAHVVRASDLLLDREVAVKLVRESAETEADLDRFLAETRTLARLSHPGLVTVLDGGTSASGSPYLVMELVDGPALSDSLETPLEPVVVADIGSQVAAALAYAHSQGVVHRDVKPGNVLLRGDGRVKLADFGIAKLLGEQSLQTRTGTVLGSVHYLAPEQVAFEEITPAVDVYALGLLMLRCLTGRHAFEGPTIESALARLSADPEIPADLPSDWRDLLTAMTARAPEDRPSAADVAARLSDLCGTRTTARVAARAPAGGPAPATRRAGVLAATRSRLAAARTFISASPAAVGAVVLAVALVVAAGVADGGAGSDEPSTDQPTSQPEPAPPAETAPDQPVTKVQPASAPTRQPQAGADDAAPVQDRAKDTAKDTAKDGTNDGTKGKPKSNGKGNGNGNGKGKGKGKDAQGKRKPGKSA